MLKPYKVNTALQSVFLGTKPKRTVVCNQSSKYAKTQKRIQRCNKSSLVANLNGQWYSISLPTMLNPKSEYSVAISLPWYET